MGYNDFDQKTKIRYLDFYMKGWRMMSMGSRNDMNPVWYWTVFGWSVATNAVFIFSMYSHIYTHARDIDGIAEIVDFATLFTAGLFRFIYTFAYGPRFDELAAFVHENFAYESIANGRKLNTDKYVKKSKIVNYSYLSFTILWVLQITATRVVGSIFTQNTGPVVAIRVKMPYNESTQLGTILTYVIHFTSYCTTVMIYCFGDAYWYVIFILTTAQFEFISHSLRSLALDENEQKETDFDYVERIVVSCLNHHQMLRRCIRMMENLLNTIVLVDFLHAVTSITFILFDMTIAINQQSPVKVLNLFGYFLLSVGHMWILDYFGNELTAKEEAISTAIYEIPWYTYPNKIRKEVVLLMLLSSHPNKLTCGKLYSLSLEFFGKSMRTIFSYFTVLLQMREK